MANYQKENVVYVDTTATFANVRRVRAVKYIGNTSGTADIKDENTSGSKLWQEDGTADTYNANLDIRASKGIRVEIANGAAVYIYT